MGPEIEELFILECDVSTIIGLEPGIATGG